MKTTKFIKVICILCIICFFYSLQPHGSILVIQDKVDIQVPILAPIHP